MESNQQQNRDNLRNLEVKEYQYKDKINLNDKKLWLLLGIIILSLIIFFIILANTNDNFSPLVLLALTLPWVVIIVCFIAVYVLIKKRVPVVANMRENHIQLIKESKIMDSLSYSEATKKLTVRKRSKYLNEFVSAVPIVIDSSTKKPDSLVFTSATVGGVTTGGIERVEGKTTTRRTFSGLYRLVFNVN